MSQETQIGNLSGGISDEDSKLVDSILNDLNSHSEGQQQQQPQQHQQPQQGEMGQMPRQELTPEQMRQIQMQRQMAMQQQQLMQQQEMAQRMAAQQMAEKQMAGRDQDNQMPGGQEKKEMVQKNDSIIDQIKNESKSVILVIFLSIILNLEQVDGLFKTQPSIFTTESGSLNMQAIFVKALIIGAIFYAVKTYLL
jgi:hypothetical protein